MRQKKKTKKQKQDSKNSLEFVLCWSCPCWVWDLLLNTVCISREIPLEKTKIVCERLSIGDGLWVEDRLLCLSPPCWDPADVDL